MPIVGATNDQVVVAQARFSDSGLYSVVVSNAEGSVTSAEASLTVNPPKAGDLDYSFVWGGSINGTVQSVAVQPDGKILIGGRFTTVHGAAESVIARLNADGTTDYTFMQGLSGADDSVFSIALQSDGKVLIAGYAIARLHADGSLDSGFQNGLSRVVGGVSSLAVQSDGKVLIGGENGIARLNGDGSLDSTFPVELAANEGSPSVSSVAVQTDGKVLIGGFFSTINGVSRHSIARLNPNGSLDSGFKTEISPDANPIVNSIAVQNDGKVLIGGGFKMVNGVGFTTIARLNADGTLDIGFQNAGTDGFVYSLALQTDGKALIGGPFENVNGMSRRGIARLNADGTVDSTFQIALSETYDNNASSIAAQSDGKVLIGGYLANGQTIARFNADGTLDSGFLFGANRLSRGGAVLSATVQSDGKVLIGGYFTTVNGERRNNIARLNMDGTLDSGFQNELSAVDGGAIAVQSDGRVLIGGDFTTVNGMSRRGIARLNADGTLDSTFQVAANEGGVSSVVVQTDGKVLIGGHFTTVNGVGHTKIARLHADGTLDSGFQTEISGDISIVRSVAVQSDGKVLIGGAFDAVNGVSRRGIARLNADGTLDSGFQGGLPGAETTLHVFSIALQSDGRVLIGGFLVNGRSPNIARLSADGTLDRGFQTELSGGGGWGPFTFPGSVYSVAVQSDRKVLIGGSFGTVNGVSRSSLARLNADGSLDTGFQSGVSRPGGGDFVSLSVSLVAVQSDGKVIIGGGFTIVNGVPAPGIARLWASADVPPRIQSVHRGGADANLTWDAIPNRTYHVQYKENLSANTWTDLAGDISTTTGTASKTDSTLGNASQRFYRAVLLP